MLAGRREVKGKNKIRYECKFKNHLSHTGAYLPIAQGVCVFHEKFCLKIQVVEFVVY